MHKAQWRLQDAKAQFSQVVEAAMHGEPQHVTKRGRDAVVVLSETSYRALRESAHTGAPSFVAHLLSISVGRHRQWHLHFDAIVLAEVLIKLPERGRLDRICTSVLGCFLGQSTGNSSKLEVIRAKTVPK